VSAEGAEDVTLTVTQAGWSATLSIEPATLNFVHEGGDQTVTVTTNVAEYTYVVEEGNEWLQVDKTESGLTIHVDANNGESRSATVTLSAEGVEDVTLTVTQAALATEPTLVLADRTDWEVAARGGNHNWEELDGRPSAVLDGDVNTGWHSDGATPPPQVFVLNMKGSKTIHSLRISHLPNALDFNPEIGGNNNWIYFANVDIYISDSPISPDDDPSWFGEPAVKYVYNFPGETTTFDIPLDAPTTGQYVMMVFYKEDDPENSGYGWNYMSFTELNVWVEE
jgi:hypothetical protein